MCGRYVVTNAVHKTREIVKSAIAVNDTDNFNASPQQNGNFQLLNPILMEKQLKVCNGD